MKKPDIQYIAAKAIIQRDDGSVLVLKQSDSTISGHEQYHPPGGILELGESLEECLIREVKEEIGADIEVEQLFDVGEWSAQRDDTIMQFVGVFYVCRLINSDFKLQSSEVSGVGWVNADSIEAFDITEPSKKIIAKYLASKR